MWKNPNKTITNAICFCGDDDGEVKNDKVYIEGNSIWFYGEVNNDTIANLVFNLRKLANNDTVKMKGNINLFIHSFGGSLLAGFAAYDSIKRIAFPVHTYIDGVCASAATFLYFAGEKRYCTKNSSFMIHQLNNTAWRTTHEGFRDELQNQTNWMRQIKDIYVGHTKIPKEEIEEILRRDLYFVGDKLIELGIANEMEAYK